MKNLLIIILLTYKFYTMNGWAVDGPAKVIVYITLCSIVAVIITTIENTIKRAF